MNGTTPDPEDVQPDSEDESPMIEDLDRVALNGADVVANWDALEGGWSTLLRGPGARLAAAGYQLAAAAIDDRPDETRALTTNDLVTGSDGAFTSDRFAALQGTLVEGELAAGTELRERLTLALERAFEIGAQEAISDARRSTPS